MDKFVIEGGYPLSGTVVPAGNKNAALPILAASLLTDEEVVIGERAAHPRRRLHARAARGPRRQRALARRPRARRCGPTAAKQRGRRGARQPDPRLVPARRAARWRASARRDMPPPGGDVIGRRRLDPHLDALERARRADRGQRATTTCGPPTGLRACDIFMDEASVMATENALMAAALTPGVTTIAQRRLASRTCRTSRACSSRWGRRSTASARTSSTVHGPRAARRRAPRDLRRTTSRSRASWRWPP